MNSKRLPFDSEKREIADNREHHIDFDLAYRAMIGALAPSFVHELNNPLTVLLSSTDLLKKLTPLDEDFKEVIGNISDSSCALTDISANYRRILKANTAIGVRNIRRLCDDMILVLGYRFKNESLAPVFCFGLDLCEIALSTKEFYFCLYSVLQLCLRVFIFHQPDRESTHILKINFENDRTGYCRLTLQLPGISSKKVPTEITELPNGFSHFIPPFLEKQVSVFFHFVLKQTLLIFHHRKVDTVWEVGHTEIKLHIALPCKCSD